MRRALVPVVLLILATAAGLLAVVVTNTTPQLGLDLQGGLSVVLAPEREVQGDALDKALDIVRNRVDALGVAEPEISRQGDTIVVDLPGVKEQAKARELIGTTAELQFRSVLGTAPVPGSDLEEELSTSTTAAPPTTVAGETPTTVAVPTDTATTIAGEAARGAQEDPTATTAPPADPGATTTTDPSATTTTAVAGVQGDHTDPQATIVVPDRDNQVLYTLGPAEVTGGAVKSARARFEQQWLVTVDFTSEGSAAWDAMAQRNFQRQVAIVLDGVVQSAPTIQAQEFGGSAQITGEFSEGEAKDLALVLRFGALPVELKEISVQSVSATLGRDQLRTGLIAGLAGLGIVFLYMLAYYRLLGLVVWLGVGLTAAATYAIVAWLGSAISLTLTIAGVVGLIVSISVIVDSNIVYFERLKEEVRSGRTVRSAVDRGFTKAFRTIVAADIVSVLSAILLYFFAVGAVRGFAFYLGLATFLDLIVSYFFMHPLVVLMARSPRFGQRMLERSLRAGREAA